MIRSFRPNKDTLLFNIKNIPLHYLTLYSYICKKEVIYLII